MPGRRRRADPYPGYERLRPLGPCSVADDGTLVTTGYRACAALMRDHRLTKTPERLLTAAGYPRWRDRPSLRLMFGSLLMLNPPDHTRLRRLAGSAFTTRRVQALRPDVAVFEAPDRLLLDRTGPPPVSFGGGIRYCLGAGLARLEAQVALPRLLRRFPRLQLAGVPVRGDTLTLHGYTELPVFAG